MDLQTQHDLELWMADIGPQLDAAEVRAFEPGLWAIAFETDLVVEIEHDELAGKLVLSAEIGTPPAGQAAAINRLLLQASGQRGEIGSSRMGLDAVDNIVWQIDDVFIGGLSLDAFVVFLREFADQAAHARTELGLLAEPAKADSSAAPRLFMGYS
jgi:hypothetical protein